MLKLLLFEVLNVISHCFRRFMSRWKQLADRSENTRKFVKIALVGKYTQLGDAYASVIKALEHAALATNHKLKLTTIAAADLEDETKIKVFKKFR